MRKISNSSPNPFSLEKRGAGGELGRSLSIYALNFNQQEKMIKMCFEQSEK